MGDIAAWTTTSHTGGPGYGFANEYPTDQYPPNDPKLQEPVLYPRGTLAMAHSQLPNSNGSQFFLVYMDSQLPPDYTVFGKIQDDGLATLDKIAKGGVTPVRVKLCVGSERKFELKLSSLHQSCA